MFDAVKRLVPMLGLMFTSAIKYFYVITKEQISELLTTYHYEPESELHSAARKGNISILRILLENEEWGKFANFTNCKSETPLHLVSCTGNIDGVHILLDYGADSTLCDMSGMNCLHKAATGGHKHVIDLIIKSQGYGSLNVKDAWGWTPLQRALLNFHYQTAAVLLEHGCCVDEEDEKGRTALHVVSSYGHVRMVTMLISKGANVDCQDAKGWTPLMLSVVGGHVQVVRDLIHKGCNINLTNKDGIHALTICCRGLNRGQYSWYSCALELISAGANNSHIISAMEDFWSRYSSDNRNNNNNEKTHNLELKLNLIRLLTVSSGNIPGSIVSEADWWLNQETLEDNPQNHILKLLSIAGCLSYTDSQRVTQCNRAIFSCPRLKDLARCACRRYMAQVHGNVIKAMNHTKALPFGLKELLLLNDV